MSNELTELKSRIAMLSDEELLTMVSVDSAEYRKEAIDCATEELARRGVSGSPIEEFDNDEIQDVTISDIEPKYKGVRGWLLLLCISITIINPLLSFADTIATFRYRNLHPDLLPGMSGVIITGVLLSIGVACFSLYAGFTLWSMMRNAVKIAKAYLLTYLVYSIIAFLLPLMAGLSSHDNWVMLRLGIGGLIRSFVYFGVWYAYLSKSERVKATYVEDASVFTDSEHNILNPGR